MSGKIIIFGVGYVGRHLAEALLQDGWEVVGTCRSHSTRDMLTEMGMQVEIFDGTAPISNWDELSIGASHILCSVPPKDKNDPVYKYFSHKILAMNLAWLGYLSTTGVYGDHSGEWVDENSETRGTSPRTIDRLEAEKAWLSLGVPAHVFRLAGIYGVGRSAIDNLSQGTARNIVKNDHYFSRIHVNDIVQTLIASINAPQSASIYNVADNEPSPTSDVIEYAAKLMGLTAPPRIEAATAVLSEMAQEFYDNNKRVKNDLIKNELGVSLKYPTYREGLRAVLARRIVAKTS